MKKPVRAVLPYDENNDSIISIFDGKKEFMKIFESVGQLSGLAYKRNLIDIPFNEECFPAHIYPFAGILRNYKCVFLKDYTVAIGIMDSQTRSISAIYELSPTLSWLRMYRSVFSENKFSQQRKWGEEHILTNFIGLVQLKNYARKGLLRREIKILLKERPINILRPAFWIFSLGTLIIPRSILIPLVDWWKVRVVAKSLKKINFENE
jgi:hypothetical protein